KPAGTLTTGDLETALRIDTLGRDTQTIGSYPVANIDGRVVYIRDVARVEDTTYEQRSGYHHFYWAQGRNSRRGPAEAARTDEAIEISVLQSPEASSPVVIAAVRDEVKR